MRSPDFYLREAEIAEALARQMSRHDHRDECLRIARTWREAAAAAEQRDETALQRMLGTVSN